MSDYHDDFFDEQKPWSRLKNQILSSYMPPYLTKVARLRKKIVLVDAFAGPGGFLDGTEGSPLILCRAADQCVPGEHAAYFFNNRPSHHDALVRALRADGLSAAMPLLGDAVERLSQLISELRDETLFL